MLYKKPPPLLSIHQVFSQKMWYRTNKKCSDKNFYLPPHPSHNTLEDGMRSKTILWVSVISNIQSRKVSMSCFRERKILKYLWFFLHNFQSFFFTKMTEIFLFIIIIFFNCCFFKISLNINAKETIKKINRTQHFLRKTTRIYYSLLFIWSFQGLNRCESNMPIWWNEGTL